MLLSRTRSPARRADMRTSSALRYDGDDACPLGFPKHSAYAVLMLAADESSLHALVWSSSKHPPLSQPGHSLLLGGVVQGGEAGGESGLGGGFGGSDGDGGMRGDSSPQLVLLALVSVPFDPQWDICDAVGQLAAVQSMAESVTSMPIRFMCIVQT